MLKTLSRKFLLPILLTGSLAGCGGGIVNSLGAGPLPPLPEPNPPQFTDEEKTTLTKWAADEPVLFKKIQGQAHAYRETIRSYNKYARATNKKKLEAIGFDEKAIKATLNEDNSAGND